jgi:hypothetical protein
MGAMFYEFVEKAAAEAVVAASRKNWEAFEESLNVLNETIVSILMVRNDEDIRLSFDCIEQAWTELHAMYPVYDKNPKTEGAMAVGEFRGLTRLLGTAKQYEKPMGWKECSKIVAKPLNSEIVRILAQNESGLSNAELKKRLPKQAFKLDHALATLRKAAIVLPMRIGLETFHHLSDGGKMFAKSL